MEVGIDNFMNYCRICKSILCKKCCHLIITQKTPLGLEPSPIIITQIQRVDKESMKVEPSYMHERYAGMRAAEPEATVDSSDVSGGEE